MTFPSSLNILTSSICAIGCTLSFLSDVCNFLSSVPELLCTFFTFRRGVPLPLFLGEEVSLAWAEVSSMTGKIFPRGSKQASN